MAVRECYVWDVRRRLIVGPHGDTPLRASDLKNTDYGALKAIIDKHLGGFSHEALIEIIMESFGCDRHFAMQILSMALNWKPAPTINLDMEVIDPFQREAEPDNEGPEP